MAKLEAHKVTGLPGLERMLCIYTIPIDYAVVYLADDMWG